MTWLYKHKELVDALEQNGLKKDVIRKFNDIVPFEWALKHGLLTPTERDFLELTDDDTDDEALDFYLRVIHYDDPYCFLEFLEHLDSDVAQEYANRLLESPTVNKEILEDLYHRVFIRIVNGGGHNYRVNRVRINADGTINNWNNLVKPDIRPLHEVMKTFIYVFAKVKLQAYSVLSHHYLPYNGLLMDILRPKEQKRLLEVIREKAAEKCKLFADVHEELLATIMHPDRIARKGKDAFLASLS